jgi:hypothetical protein
MLKGKTRWQWSARNVSLKGMCDMLKGKTTMFRDQYGRAYWARTLKELRDQLPGRVSKMYVDMKDGRTVHCGYVVGSLWLTAFSPLSPLEIEDLAERIDDQLERIEK